MEIGLKKLIFAACALAVSAGYYFIFRSTETAVSTDTQAPSVLATVTLPDTLSTNAQIGRTGFDAKCAACHGPNAAGQGGVAPPLIHKIYEPSHHGDEAFQRAAAVGVRSHHWPFGDMPPVGGMTRGDVTMIVAYIRELQRANGIN
jgi:mono/diheme cytochrome c family protein